jgi:hypothetical protein
MKRQPSVIKRLRPRSVASGNRSQVKNEFGLDPREMLFCLHVIAGLRRADASVAAGYGGDPYKRASVLMYRETVQNFLAKFTPDNKLGDQKALIPKDKEGIIQFIREVASGVRKIGSVQLQALRDYAGIAGISMEASTGSKGVEKMKEVVAAWRAGPVAGPEDEVCPQCGSLVTAEKKTFDAQRKSKAAREKKEMLQ